MTEEKKDGLLKDRLDQLKSDSQVIKDFIPRLKDFLKKYKKLLIIGGSIAAVIGAILTYELLEFSSSPEFCALFCHEMATEVEAWEKSWHAKKGVKCVECHYEPGIKGVVIAKINAQWQLAHHILGTYSNHPLEEAKEEGLELAAQNIHLKGNTTYYIKAEGYALKVVNINCRRCHKNAFDIERSSGRSVRMAHKQHIDKGYECTDCHIEIVHGMEDPTGRNYPTMWTCFFKCHNDEKAPRKDCTLCHVGQKEMWEGEGARGVKKEEAMMLGEVKCVECHLKEKDYIPPKNGEVCVDCHDEKYAQTLKDWQLSFKAKLDKLENILDELDQRIKDIEAGTSKKVMNFEEAKKLRDDARYNDSIVKHDGSKGVHNYDYAISTLDASIQMARDSRAILLAEKK